MTTFDDIFPEYFTLYRGQATNIPSASDPEYKIALKLAKNSVRKWDRADGQEWNVLWTTLSNTNTPRTIQAGVKTYPITDMRKPPKQITIDGSSVAVVEPEKVDMIASNNVAWFTGSPATGYTLNFRNVTDEMIGKSIDFIYLRKPTEIVDGSSEIDMSDPSFLIHDMLAARFTNARNGFAVKVHKQEALTALQNMKIEDMSGTYGNSDNLGSYGAGWGRSVGTHNADIV